MLRLLFLSSISALVASGCSDDCGPGGAPDFGLNASSSEVTLTYGNLTAGANNDCPDPMAPMGVISVTIAGTQKDGMGLATFCVPRPDLLDTGVNLGTGFRIIDLNGDAEGCMFSLDPTPVTGTAKANGICDNGKDSAGFALIVEGFVSLRRVCPTNTDNIQVSLAGTVAVSAK
jgi:hypothetical protein